MPTRVRLLPVLALSAFWAICVPSARGAQRHSFDILAAARADAARRGSALARDRLSETLTACDDSHGDFEKRIWNTNSSNGFTYPDSVDRLTAAQRARTGIYFCLGYNQQIGEFQRIIRAAANEISRRGFRGACIPTLNHGTKEENARAVATFMRGELPHVDRVLIAGFSKGGADLQEFLSIYSAAATERDRKKIRVWMNFAGVLRGSCVADWLVHDSAVSATAFRWLLRVESGNIFRPLKDIDSIARDPWQSPAPPRLRPFHSSMLVIDYPVLPEGSDGHPHRHALFHWLETQSLRQRPKPGPCDGLVETAAAVLPREASLRQWIVRVRGSHAVLDGNYLNGDLVSPGYPKGGTSRLISGIHLMDSLLRALPKSTFGL